jgi:leucyl-tRNA synthetase
MARYNIRETEDHWQARWAEIGLRPVAAADTDMDGLRARILDDVVARYRRARGDNSAAASAFGGATLGRVSHVTFRDGAGAWLEPHQVVAGDDGTWLTLRDGGPVTVGRPVSMATASRNTIDPAEAVDSYGADAIRLFLISNSPPERDLEWREAGIEGAWRFVNRIWRAVTSCERDWGREKAPAALVEPGDGPAAAATLTRVCYAAIQAVTRDLERARPHTAVAQVRSLANHVLRSPDGGEADSQARRVGIETTLRLLSPMTPHLCEELWYHLGHRTMLAQTPWPATDRPHRDDDTISVPVRFNGRLRATLEVSRTCGREAMVKRALAQPVVISLLAGRTPRRVIAVSQKMVSINL